MIDITKLSKISGIPASTLRYYEEKGLIQSIGRHGLRRVFDSDIMERLSLIALGQNAGFSLDEISTIFIPRQLPKIDRKMLLDKADEIDKKIKELKAIKKGLQHAAKCPEENHVECPKFRYLMDKAIKTNAKSKNL